MSKIDGNISGVGFGTLIPFRGWWYPLYPRFLSTFSDKLITFDMPKIEEYTSGVGFGTNLIPFRGWWYPLFQRFLSTFSNKLIARREGR